ncbi:unnamed protein product [Dibothriocephalus latus]|uniref:Uncharacterized protein n=1 Tax=Dibothriocephalus latus TaxID=60516 RepID=A0A3P7P0J7_DIBLA|nr:unnamed protein product [Dibothriocephalus latus]
MPITNINDGITVIKFVEAYDPVISAVYIMNADAASPCASDIPVRHSVSGSGSMGCSPRDEGSLQELTKRNGDQDHGQHKYYHWTATMRFFIPTCI